MSRLFCTANLLEVGGKKKIMDFRTKIKIIEQIRARTKVFENSYFPITWRNG